MPARTNNGAVTSAEQQVEEALDLAKPKAREEVEVPPLDMDATEHDPELEIRGEFLSRKLVETPDESGWRAFWRRGGRRPVIRLTGSVISGLLDLRAADLPYLLEFDGCRFEQAPDLRQASLAGLVLNGCRFPGIYGRNLTTSNDVRITDCDVESTIDLVDAKSGGSLVLDDSRLHSWRVLNADRLTVAGALVALRLQTSGQIRIPGARITGNLNLSGADLHSAGRSALNAIGVHIGGSLRCDVDPRDGGSARIAGTVLLTNAVIQGDIRMRNAALEPDQQPGRSGESERDDPVSALSADRSEVRGNVYLDRKFRSWGTIRAVNARIGGDLRISGATINVRDLQAPRESTRQLRAVHLDGTHVDGNIEASGLRASGQLRVTDLNVGGSFHLNDATLTGPQTDVFRANRTHVGSDLACRGSTITGGVQLQGVTIGASVDLRAASLTEPAPHRHRPGHKPALDLGDARIGRDLVCAKGARRFHAGGQVRLRRTVVGRQANLWGCELGQFEDRPALNAFGLSCQELSLLPGVPPRGPVVLRKAECELFGDDAPLWEAVGGLDLEDFRYQNFSRTVTVTDRAGVKERLARLHAASLGRYQPSSYDQLAAVFRDNGTEDHAVTVLIAKQRHRYQAMAASSRWLTGKIVQLWSLLQWVTVNYGYRPSRAAIWLVLFAGAGTCWFSYHPQDVLNHEDHPEWDPFLYTVDQLVPIVNFGNDEMWRSAGASQWITAVLIAVGWILATTVAAGISRALRRDS